MTSSAAQTSPGASADASEYMTGCPPSVPLALSPLQDASASPPSSHSLSKHILSSSADSSTPPPPHRPGFNSQLTSDRLREGSASPSFRARSSPGGSMDGGVVGGGSNIRPGRRSIFREVGLDEDAAMVASPPPPDRELFSLPPLDTAGAAKLSRSQRKSTLSTIQSSGVSGGSGGFFHVARPSTSSAALSSSRASTSPHRQDKDDDAAAEAAPAEASSAKSPSSSPWYARWRTGGIGVGVLSSALPPRPHVKTASSAPPPTVSALARVTLIALLIALFLPAFSATRSPASSSNPDTFSSGPSFTPGSAAAAAAPAPLHARRSVHRDAPQPGRRRRPGIALAAATPSTQPGLFAASDRGPAGGGGDNAHNDPLLAVQPLGRGNGRPAQGPLGASTQGGEKEGRGWRNHLPSVDAPVAAAERLTRRALSPTQICRRWSHQVALLNGTLYIYGGQASTTADQTTDTWNNNFLTLDLTRSWSITSPALTGLTRPVGPPAVANGYLWNTYTALFLYGGEFADNPFAPPAAVSTWRYAVSSQSWTEFASPATSAGTSATADSIPVQRAAEGAGISVPELGLSFYFGGHLDLSTTAGWSNQIARVYLPSLLEFTHPGYANDAVFALVAAGAPEGGAYRNVTQGGLQAQGPTAFPERADGALVFVPGWGPRGVLIGLGGGTADVFTDDMSVLDVYDIATSVWYHQQTTGEAPGVRVNPCAVVASAPDASSFQIYLYGGQNLQPYQQQIQYSDMYILSIPSFIWIKVPASSSTPPARAGHTCTMRDGQIVVVGGYVGQVATGAPPCDTPGIYVFNASSLAWSAGFTSYSTASGGAAASYPFHAPDAHPDNSVLAGSAGYVVPDAVAQVIGGGPKGGATATVPQAGATAGPFATGKPPVFTVTAGANGATATVTQWGASGSQPTGSGKPPPGGGGGGNGMGDTAPATKVSGGMVAAGVMAGLAGLAAAYLGWCAWLYRRQVRAYRAHLAVSNRYSGVGGAGGGVWRGGGSRDSGAGFLGVAPWWATGKARGRSRHRRDHSAASSDDSAGAQSEAYFGWVGTSPPPGEDPPLHQTFSSHSSGLQGYAPVMSPGQGVGSASYGPLLTPGEAPGWVGDAAQAARLSGGSGSGSGVGSGALAGSGSGSGLTTTDSGTGSGTGSRLGAGGPAAMMYARPMSPWEQEQLAKEEAAGRVQGRHVAPGPTVAGGSQSSTENLIDGQEPSFFSVVMRPRTALRVVNGME